MRKVSVFAAVLILLFAQGSLWAVWEGNAGVGAAGNFPDSGMYILSDIFPSNTLVYVQNLETGLSTRVVVAGKSGIPGIIAFVSPEVAETLNIKSGSVSRVRISLPPEIPEIAVSDFAGVSTDSIDSPDPDLNPAAMVAMASEESASMNLPPAYEEIARASVAEAAVKDEAGEIAQAIEIEEAVVEQNEPVYMAEVYDEPSLLVMPKDAPVPEVAALNAEDRASKAPDDHKVEFVPALPEKARADLPADVQDWEVAEVALVPSALNPPQGSEAISEREVPEVASIMLSQDSPSLAEEENVALVPPVIVAVEEEAATPVEEIETEIALEPVETYITEYIYIPPEDSAEAVSTVPEVPPNAPLEQGYYVQIGSYLDAANVRRIVDSYSDKYPLAFADTPSAAPESGTKKRALVGRLEPDETGAVLEFFRNEGFKDAFVFVVN